MSFVAMLFPFSVPLFLDSPKLSCDKTVNNTREEEEHCISVVDMS